MRRPAALPFAQRARWLLATASRSAAVLWGWLRALTGDDAYERYCAQQTGAPALGRRAFYDEQQRRKWSGVSRCC
jgi:uncharacterized short protein YbdD (DUF466 family)